MTSVEGLQKFLDEHPLLGLSEKEKLMYRAGFADGCLEVLNRTIAALEAKAKENV